MSETTTKDLGKNRITFCENLLKILLVKCYHKQHKGQGFYENYVIFMKLDDAH